MIFILKLRRSRTSFKNNLNIIHPGSSCSIPKAADQKDNMIIKNIKPQKPTEDLTNALQEGTTEQLYIKKIHFSSKYSPLPIISVIYSQNLAQKFAQQRNINI